MGYFYCQNENSLKSIVFRMRAWLSNIKKSELLFWVPIVIYRILFYVTTKPKLFPDSYGYIGYSFSKLFFYGELNGRTPIYPLVLKTFVKVIGSKYYLEAVTIFQALVSFIAVIYIYKICKLFKLNKLLTGIVVYLYAFNTSIIGWDRAILTESLAVSFLVIMFYYLSLFIKDFSVKDAIIAQFIAFFMTFERPSSVVFWFIISLFIIIYTLIHKLDRKKIFLVCGVTSFSIVTYMMVFSSQFGIFSLTDAVPRQHLYVVMEKGWYQSSSDKEFVKSVETAKIHHPKAKWKAMIEVLDCYGNKKITELTNECYRKNIKNFILDRVHQLHKDSRHDYITGYVDYRDLKKSRLKVAVFYFNELFRIEVRHTLIIFFITGVLLLIHVLVKKSINWIGLGLFVSMLASLFISYYGTCGEYPRTMLCMVPLSYISIIYILAGCKSLNDGKDLLTIGSVFSLINRSNN